MASAAVQVVRYYDTLVRCFVDTEFYEDGTTIDLISIGAVRSDGGEFYAVNRDAKLDRVSDWVRANVLPKLPPYGDPLWQPRDQIAKGFSAFMNARKGGAEPTVHEVWGYYSDYDWVAICQMYRTMMDLPNHFPKYCLDLKQLSWMLGDPRHPKQDESTAHNSLEDARWNRDLFAFLRACQVTSDHWLKLDEGERQALLLSLAHLANERPGWDDMLNRIALRIDNDAGGRAEMFDGFKTLNTGRVNLDPDSSKERPWNFRCGTCGATAHTANGEELVHTCPGPTPESPP